MQRALIAAAVAATTLVVNLPCALHAQQAPEVQATPQSVPVRSVTLFSSGVGYFEHYGTVRGDASAELRFKTEQIDDVLKSLVLQDLDGGTLSAINYPSLDPLDKTLASFQVDLRGNPSLGALLNQLRGTAVEVVHRNENIQGTILGVEKRQRPSGNENDKIIETEHLNLIAGGMIRSVPLDELRSLTLQDARLQEELGRALEALVQARDQEKKPVTLNFRGEGERRVRVGYVVETPIWKTSYRLLMGDKDQAGLQGWAIVENQTDNDWTNVQLSLVSGRPISFVQRLSEPLYIRRPVVEPELFASLRPKTYAGAVAMDMAEAVGGEMGVVQNEMRRARAIAPQAAPTARLEAVREGWANQPIDPAASIRSAASAASLGELFQYTVRDVSLPRQTSAMIPIVTDSVSAERVSIYNASILARHPLNGAILKNTTGKHLLQGPITVFDGGGYAGDAQIENLPPGQQRLLSYGVDLQVLVDASTQKNESAIQTARLVKGVLHLSRKQVFTQTYRIDNKGERARQVIVEHPVRANWKLVNTPDPMESTDQVHRFRVAVQPGKAVAFNVNQEITTGETIAVLPADVGQLVVYQRSGEIPQKVREALAEVITRKNALVETDRQISRIDQELTQIAQDQNRIRENIRVVDRNSAAYGQWLDKLTAQEKQVEAKQKQRDELRHQRERQQQELEQFVQNLNVG